MEYHFDEMEKTRSYSPRQRIVLKEILKVCAHNFSFDKAHLEKLIKNEDVIIVRVNLRKNNGTYLEEGYQFTEKAEKYWQEVLNERTNAFDFSETD